MNIVFHKNFREFHLYNNEISYIIKILPNNQLGNIYFGKRIPDSKNYTYLLNTIPTTHAVFVKSEPPISLELMRQEYPSYGTTDYRDPAFEIKQENGSNITDFQFVSYNISDGKPKLKGLPSTYVEDKSEAKTLEIVMADKLINCEIVLSYTIFKDFAVIARNARFINKGNNNVILSRALSLSIDLPDENYIMLDLDGAWGRERQINKHRLHQGIQSVSSSRGCSSAEHNPFMALCRPNSDENSGEVLGFSLVYSGNFLAQAEVDNHNTTRAMMGINPQSFSWTLKGSEEFQTPEAIVCYSDCGLNKMSQTFHKLYRTRLARGYWRDRERPIVINNWESTEFNFDEKTILSIAENAKKLGIEMMVLDDGWFGKRNSDTTSLGDWYVNKEKIPDGISGLSRKINALGLKFGLWFEPEMVNKESNLYKNHPDWILSTPKRSQSVERNQYVLDFSNKDVVNEIYCMMSKIIRESKISYIKWDMNRYITECFSSAPSNSSQGEVMHRYILGVYSLYERLTQEFPEVLFEGCASGGGRFDPGILSYAPQSWTSDNTDAVSRLKIQYGTSLVYPLSCISCHVSDIPNQQVLRSTPLDSRANVAYFGVFGYELDLGKMCEEEKQKIKEQIRFVKKYRSLFQKGLFYRLKSPFEGNDCAWMVVSQDKSEAIVGYYKILNVANESNVIFKLCGLDSNSKYKIESRKDSIYYGSELMNVGIMVNPNELCNNGADFSSVIYCIKKCSAVSSN